MDNKTKLEVAIELAGFNQRDRVLFSSLFKVSGLRPFIYREWSNQENTLPACLLLDIDEEAHRVRYEFEAQRPGRFPIIAIGKEVPSDLRFDAHIKRPIRWAEILHTLDTSLGISVATSAPVDSEKTERLSDAENELELGQIDQWYDRTQPITFKSDPAVLVVDPDPAGGNFISAKLAGSGYRVDHAPTAEGAISLLAQNRYNCVILEMQLPDKPGFEICNLLKQRQDRRRTASIILTASQNPLDRVRAISAGCDAFLSKPIQPQQLLRTLEKFLPNWRMGE